MKTRTSMSGGINKQPIGLQLLAAAQKITDEKKSIIKEKKGQQENSILLKKKHGRVPKSV